MDFSRIFQDFSRIFKSFLFFFFSQKSFFFFFFREKRIFFLEKKKKKKDLSRPVIFDKVGNLQKRSRVHLKGLFVYGEASKTPPSLCCLFQQIKLENFLKHMHTHRNNVLVYPAPLFPPLHPTAPHINITAQRYRATWASSKEIQGGGKEKSKKRGRKKILERCLCLSCTHI